jgi:acid phosphatase
MPHDGYTGCETDKYARKHSPWVDFPHNVPASDNLVYRGFPSSPPTLAWITPNLCNDMHDCRIVHGDKWLAKNLPPIIDWDNKHDGLLIVTFDEAAPDLDGSNHVATILLGPMVTGGSTDGQDLDHYAVLHTVEALFGLPCIKDECSAPVISGIWNAR